jgi:hypothetical protein
MKNVCLIPISFLWLVSIGQTRFYTDNSTSLIASDITPSVSTWTNTSGSLVSRPKLTIKPVSTVSAFSLAVDNSSSTATTCYYRITTPALVAQTISGTVKGQFLFALSSATGCTAQPRVKITVVNYQGTVVATLLSMWSGSNNITATATNRFCPPSGTALSSYSCADGDRIVIEIGIGRSAGTTARNGNIRFGTTTAGDLPEDETTTTTNLSGWVEFSNTVKYYQGVF